MKVFRAKPAERRRHQSKTQELLKGIHLPGALGASCPFILTLVITKMMHVWTVPEGKFECWVKKIRDSNRIKKKKRIKHNDGEREIK